MAIEDWVEKQAKEYAGSVIVGTVLGMGITGVIEILVAVIGVGLIVVGGVVALILFGIGAREAAIALAGILLVGVCILGGGVVYGGWKLTSLLSSVVEANREGDRDTSSESRSTATTSRPTTSTEHQPEFTEESDQRIAHLKDQYRRGELDDYEFETALEDALAGKEDEDRDRDGGTPAVEKEG